MVIAKYTSPNEYADSRAIKVLEVGIEYEVRNISIGQSHTSIYLKGFNGSFNSVIFEFYENGKELNIFKDKRFNPYI